MNIIKFFTIAFLVLISSISHSESLQVYTEHCLSALGIQEIPSFNCAQNALPDVQVTVVKKPSNLMIGSSAPINRMGRIHSVGPSVTAVFLCRDIKLDNQNNVIAGQVGLILQKNSGAGETCFFDATDAPIDTARLAQAGQMTASEWNTANNYWRSPEDISEQLDNQCWKCHANDPFVVSPAVIDNFALLGLSGTSRKMTGGYTVPSVPGGAFHHWSDYIANSLTSTKPNIPNDYTQQETDRFNDIWDGYIADKNCASSCHEIAFPYFNTEPPNIAVNYTDVNLFNGVAEGSDNLWNQDSENPMFNQNGPDDTDITSTMMPMMLNHMNQSLPTIHLDRDLNSFDENVHYRIANHWDFNGFLHVDPANDVAANINYYQHDRARWMIVRSTDGRYVIKNLETGLYLNSNYAGTDVEAGYYSFERSQWLLEFYDNLPLVSWAEGEVYYMINVDNSKYLNFEGQQLGLDEKNTVIGWWSTRWLFVRENPL